jgi:hypothetical protein
MSSPAFAQRTACHRPRKPRPPETGHTSPPPPRPTFWLASSELSEASRATDWTPPHRRRRIDVVGLQLAAVARRPSLTVSHSSIPCTYGILSIQWSSPCHLIEPYRREQAGAHAVDKPDHLRTRPALFRPSPPVIRTSMWPPGPPGPHPALHRTSLAVGKPCHLFLSTVTVTVGKEPGLRERKARGVLRGQWLRETVPQGHPLKD